jgi:Fe-S-cluster-containing dehydrogenase component/DMSO reductase anchor subunit
MPSALPLLEELLEDQQRLYTPVVDFLKAYDEASVRRRFEHLIPLEKPNPGEQYRFDVNLDSCTGCKACVSACHSLNGLDDEESWRDVGMILSKKDHSYQQTITSACHHCVDPACLNGCPVLAYSKDDITGIVRHLDDQCIGCSYCIMKCPYDVPKFNLKKGIVRKCDMCQGRLESREAPACVQACPNEAIQIKTVAVDTISKEGQIISGAFPSSYTVPTTHYHSNHPQPADAVPAHLNTLHLDCTHTPLAVMLVMTQMSAGSLIWLTLFNAFTSLSYQSIGSLLISSFVITVIGVHISVLHLGQPFKAWKAFLGWRRSWLSREIIAFGALMGAQFSLLVLWWFELWLLQPALIITAAIAATAVFASIMVYVDTQRPFWKMSLTSGKFIGTGLLLGMGLCAVCLTYHQQTTAGLAIAATVLLRWVLSGWEINQLKNAIHTPHCDWHRSALVMKKLQPHLLKIRYLLLFITGLILPALAQFFSNQAVYLLVSSITLTLISQIIERYQFFTAADGSRMPGN